jgi:hypothetical protein
MQNKEKKISNKDIASVWLKQTTLFAQKNSEIFYQALSKLQDCGVSLRTLEKITDIPKSTLGYHFSKEENKNERKETALLDS